MDPEEEKKTHESGFPKKETKYGNCEATMWVEIQEGNKGDSVSEYSKLIVLMWPAINEDGEEVGSIFELNLVDPLCYILVHVNIEFIVLSKNWRSIDTQCIIGGKTSDNGQVNFTFVKMIKEFGNSVQ